MVETWMYLVLLHLKHRPFHYNAVGCFLLRHLVTNDEIWGLCEYRLNRGQSAIAMVRRGGEKVEMYQLGSFSTLRPDAFA